MRFYAAECFLGLRYLHKKMIVHGDIKPENLVLTHDGHVKIVDFGGCTKLGCRQTKTHGTPDYFAPEIINGQQQHFANDWWAFGILCHEMLTPDHPFIRSQNTATNEGKYKDILNNSLQLPEMWNHNLQNFISRLLEKDVSRRLGCSIDGKEKSMQIRRHKFFESINFRDVYNQKITPPFYN